LLFGTKPPFKELTAKLLLNLCYITLIKGEKIMSLKNPIILALAIAISTFTAFTSSYAFADALEDTAITAEVKALLISEKDIPNTMGVTTKDRIVALNGTVDTNLQAHQAVEIASSVNNVIDVIDTQLKVKGSSSLMADALITAKVKGKIRRLYTTRKIAEGYNLSVETTDHTVHIFGSVARAVDLDTIVASANEVKGVNSVKTNIKVMSQ